MANIVGILELVNDTGGDVTDVSAKLEVNGTPIGMPINLTSLADKTKSLSTQYNVEEGAKIDWVVAFTDANGTTKNGSVPCSCAKKANTGGAITYVTLKASNFTVEIPNSGTCTGSYTSS